ncbi:MAG: gamma-glutamyltransferase [Cyanobacteria bacterium J06632_22]
MPGLTDPFAPPLTPTEARHGMVVSPHTLASQAGQRVLRQGGNAVDAAITTHAALSVTYPHMTGLGGDAFLMIYDAATGKLLGLNGSGPAAQGVQPEQYVGQQLPQRGIAAALTVPGALSAWWQAHQRLGKLPWVEVLKPAIHLARDGYPCSASQARWTQTDRALLAADAGAAATFLPEGRLPKPGEPLTNIDLARVLAAIATQGIDVFYNGAIAQRLIARIAAEQGVLTQADLANYTAEWVTPLQTTYRGHTICELPPNTQGLAVLQLLNLIEPFNLAKMGADSPDYYHLMVEATKLAFCDRDTYISDPSFVGIPVQQLLNKDYAQRRGARISFSATQHYLPAPMGGDTVYAAVVDAEGNAVSMIQSLYFDYGCGIVPPGLGFALNNRGSLFSTDPNHVNGIKPGKRPLHTLIPAMVLDGDGRPELVLGTMGGEGQPQTQSALITRVIDFGQDIQTAINLPRWRWGRTWGAASTTLAMEGRISAAVRQSLQRRGHQVQRLPDWTSEMGHAHMIQIRPEGLRGACDPRSDGQAVGY